MKDIALLVFSVLLLIISGSLFGLRLFALLSMIQTAVYMIDKIEKTKQVNKRLIGITIVCGLFGGIDLFYRTIDSFQTFSGVEKYAAIISGIIALVGSFFVFCFLHDLD